MDTLPCDSVSLVHSRAADAITAKFSCVYISEGALKMFQTISGPADCEVHSVIRFLNARNMNPAETHRQLREVYGEKVIRMEW